MVFFDVTAYFNVCLAVCLWWIYDVFVIEEEGFFRDFPLFLVFSLLLWGVGFLWEGVVSLVCVGDV